LAAKYGSDLPPDVELVPLCLRKSTQLGAARRFAEVIRKRKVDILHSHMFQASRLASPIGRLCGVPLIVETPHVREEWRQGWLKGSYVVDQLLSYFVDHYIAVSEANARYLIDQKKLSAKKIAVIQPGIDLARFDPNEPLPIGLKRGLGFGEEDPVLVVVGRLEPQKGHRILLEALLGIRSEFPQVRLVCLSDGSLRAELEKQVEQLQLRDSVRFVGYQSDLRPWLALAEVCVLPSLYEGLPAAVIEALAAARPVVASAVDGTPEVIVDGKTGLTVPPGDPASLTRAICRLLRNPEERRILALSGRQWVIDRFNKERMVQRTQAFYLDAWNQCRGMADFRVAVASQDRLEHYRSDRPSIRSL
jgi:glycosyltransferase involved in cell wall biosynthesis